MKKILRWLDVNFEAVLMTLFFAAMIILISLQVILRFVFQSGFSWGEEVARILFVWMSFSSFGYLTRNGRHVRVGFLAGKLPETWQKSVYVLCDILFLIFSVVGLKAVIRLCLDAAKYKDMLTSVAWNYNVLYMAGVLGFLLMSIRNLQVLVWRIKNWKASLERFTNYDGVYFSEQKIFFEPEEKIRLEIMKSEVEEKLEMGE